MTNWQWTHPEGILIGLTGYDWVKWPLKRYMECLEDKDRLDYCIAEARRDLETKKGPAAWQKLGSQPGDEKYALRWHGLRLLKEVADDIQVD